MKVTAMITKSISGAFRVVGLDDNKDYSGLISAKVIERAHKGNKLIEFDPNSKKYQNSKFILASRITYLDDDRTKEKKVDNATSFIVGAVENKPSFLKFDRTKWAMLARNIYRQTASLIVGPTGNGKTTSAIELAKSVSRPYFVFNLGSTQDPRTSLIGTMAYDKEKGTYFKKANFIKALETENSVIVLDEISRSHPEAFNIILPLLDFQKTIRIEENNEIVNVAEGVSFVATANIGMEYTSTRILDRALVDRFVRIDVGFLDRDQESSILNNLYPGLSEMQVKALTSLTDIVRRDLQSESPRVQTHISTRMLINTGGLVADGFSLEDAVKETILTHFESEGGADSERTFVAQAFQKAYDKSKDIPRI